MVFKKNITENKATKNLAEKLGLDYRIAAVLYQRGIKTIEDAESFLYPDESMLLPPDISNIDKAVLRIQQAIDAKEKILLFGDYDCDGICSVAMLKLFLEELGADVAYFIPSRELGYGLSVEALEYVVEMHLPDLIITVDCGITAFEEVLYCYEVLGVDIVITDHHEPAQEIPDCVVVNPKLDKDSCLKNLCGAGVVFKLIEAFKGRQKALEYIDIACIATIADVVPLIGENRVIAALGLHTLNRFERDGIKMLAQSIGIDHINSADIGFKIAPRLNAPGRMGCKNDIIPLFCSKEYFELDCIVRELNRENEKRQRESNRVYLSAIEEIKQLKLEELSVIVLHNADWDNGMLGIVASRLVSDYNRPVLMINSKNEYCRGSARSIEGINIYECLSNCSLYLEQFGGHAGAAGFTLNIAKLKDFTCFINDYVGKNYAEKLQAQSVEYDIEVDSKAMIDIDFYKQIELFEPTGEGNRPPSLLISSSLVNLSPIGNTNHVKIKLNKSVEGVLFNTKEILTGYAAKVEYHFLSTLNLRKYKNTDYIGINTSCINVQSVNNMIETAEGLYLYLMTIPYDNKVVDARFITNEEVYIEAKEKGTIIVAYSAESGKEFLEKCQDNIEIAVGKCAKNPCNRLLIYPDCVDYSNYRKAILIDAPLSTGYIDALQKTSPETEFLIAKRYGFRSIINGIEISEEAIIYTHNALNNYLNIYPDTNSLSGLYCELLKHNYKMDEYSFVAHFVTLFDYELIRHNGIGYVVFNEQFEIAKSRVINTLKKLKVQR